MEFAQLKVEVSGEDVRLTQEAPFQDEPDLIVFPAHQAKAICAAIMAAAKEALRG